MGISQIKVHYYSKNVKQQRAPSRLAQAKRVEEGETGTEIRNDIAKIKKLDTSSLASSEHPLSICQAYAKQLPNTC